MPFGPIDVRRISENARIASVFFSTASCTPENDWYPSLSRPMDPPAAFRDMEALMVVCASLGASCAVFECMGAGGRRENSESEKHHHIKR